ncbi:hypothetical protein Tco_0557768, partial [Tanacetum coccineum]
MMDLLYHDMKVMEFEEMVDELVEEVIVAVLFVHEMMRELVQAEMVLEQHLVEVDL